MYHHNINSLLIIILLIAFNFNIILCIYDNYALYLLEEGDYELLDVTDYHNLNLIVTTSKKIYKGMHPYPYSTEAQLINSTSLITLNENYLLAAYLNDSLLTKININEGRFSNLLNYEDIDPALNLIAPITSCSLSMIDNTIFIGYTEINYYPEETNKTNIIIKVDITNKDSYNDLDINTNIEIKYFIFPHSTIKTDSSRQIACEPLKVINDINNYRLVCLYETLMYAEDQKLWRYYTFATIINENLDGFENVMNESKIYRLNDNSGFKIYKLDDYNARCMLKKIYIDIYLKKNNGKITIRQNSGNPNLTTFSSEVDLFDYNNDFIFSSEKQEYFLGKSNVYYFRLNKGTSKNYFIIYNYNENNIKKLQGYYNIDNDITLVVYQSLSPSCIKYFHLFSNANIFNIGVCNDIIRLKSNETIEYNIKQK